MTNAALVLLVLAMLAVWNQASYCNQPVAMPCKPTAKVHVIGSDHLQADRNELARGF